MPGTTSKGNFGPREVELYNGIKMPILGIGTSHNGGYSQSAIVYAIQDCNYRLIDTAKRYGCEEYLKSGIFLSGINREEMFLTTKLWPSDYGYPLAKKSFKGSLNRLGVDYIDLYMMHFPLCLSNCADKKRTLEETWRSLELLYDEGLCRAIGVSNYGIKDLETMLDTASIVPHVNQVEFHPFQNPVKLREFCEENKIQVEGYCPLGKGKILTETPVKRVARHLGRTPAQVLIRWSIQNNVVTIPKSTKEDRVKKNAEVFDFEISEDDMNLLNNLHDGRRFVDISGMQEKIDSCLPDGYRLWANSQFNGSLISEYHKR